jgi:serine/threonine protein kinase
MITSESKVDFNLRKRLDELARGECSEDDFLQDVFVEPRSTPDAAWDVLAYIDQHYRRGHLSDVLFRSIESKIARQALKESNYGRTVDLERYLAKEPGGAVDASNTIDVPAPGEVSAVGGGAAPAEVPKTVELRPPADGERSAVSGVSGSAAADEWFGRVLAGRYAIHSVLGEGGMGRVFKALDRYRCELPEAHQYVALKVLHQKISERPNLLSNLRREFFCAQSLSHQNIVNVYETGSDGDIAFFTMELLEGELLSAVIDRSRPKPIDRSYAFEIIRAVGAGLSHAHARNMVHADLKPHNVMVTTSGEIRILDFGASRPSVRRRSAKSEFQCSVTPAYACCELLAGKAADPRDDLFSLACLSFELLTGRHPFDRRSSIQARDAGMRPDRPEGLSGPQWRTLRQGLSWRRADRSMSVSEWVAKLTADSVDRPPLKAETTRDDSKPWWRSTAAQRIPLWVAMLITIGLLAYNGRRTQPRPVIADHRAPALVQKLPPPAVADVQQAAPPAVDPPLPAKMPAKVSAGPIAPAAAQAPKSVEQNLDALSVAGFRVPPGQGFAEVSVRRADPENGERGFVWWTVAGSAVPGLDFASQAPTSQAFSRGRRASNIFVRLLPNPLRTSARDFHVEIGKADSDDIAAPVARTTIAIPPQP